MFHARLRKDSFSSPPPKFISSDWESDGGYINKQILTKVEDDGGKGGGDESG